MKTPKTYRLAPSTIELLERLKQQNRYATCTETEIVEIAIMYLYMNTDDDTNKAGD